jgi:gag-polypeptide of LTR copia-type
MAKIKDIIKEDRDPNLPENEVSEMELKDESNKTTRITVRKNELAMVSFSIAFVTEKAMNIIYAACTENWPDREAHLVVHKLMTRYRPLDTVSKIEMRQQLSKIKMKKGMNPTVVFETLTAIQNQYLGPGKKLLQDKLIAIILDIATEEYRPILSVERRMKGKLLTVDDLENAMMEEYRQLTRNQSKSGGMEGELLLFGQGMCCTCGSSGH